MVGALASTRRASAVAALIMASAMSRASRGSEAVALTVITELSLGSCALTRCVSVSGAMSSPSSSMTALVTLRLEKYGRYWLARCVARSCACMLLETLSPVGTWTMPWEVAVYNLGRVNIQAPASRVPINAATLMRMK